MTGLSSARWQYRNFSNSSSTHYLVAVNGSDQYRFSYVGDGNKKALDEKEIRAAIVRAMGREFDFEILSLLPWIRREYVADSYGSDRVFLVGDAAHNVHPLAGQGVNLGLRDARELASVLKNRGAQYDCGDYALLRRYERARKEDVLSMSLATDGLQKLFASKTVWASTVRNLGMRMTDQQRWLKTLLTQHAAA